MAKGFAIHNALTNHGGRIPSTQVRSSQQGNLFVRAGDGHFCPCCKCWSTVIKSHDHIIFDGKAVAYVGDQLTCGAKIQPQQNHVVGDSGRISGEKNLSNAKNLAPQHNLDNSFSDEKKYINLYIESSITNYLNFKTFLLPYDSDRKARIGTLLQTISGACTFIINHVVRDRTLFVSISMIPPILKYDATIIPWASLKAFREGQLIGNAKLTTEQAGMWDTTNGKEPVGSCEIILPEANLQLVTVNLDIGYIGQLNGGRIVPIPPSVKFSFNVNSRAKQI